MKQGTEKKVLKMIERVTRKNADIQSNANSYCPIIFHQPKRPKKQ